MSRGSAGAVTVQEILEGICTWAIRLSALALIGITGYYVYAAASHGRQLFGAIGPDGQPMSPADYHRHLQNLEMLMRFLLLASIVGIVATLGRYYAFAESGLALAVIGAAFLFGIPILMSVLSSDTVAPPGSLAERASPRDFLYAHYRIAGIAMLASGVLAMIVHGVINLAGATGRRPTADAERDRTAQQVRRMQDQFLGPCWMLPFCRDTDKQLCPIRQARKPCWRGGRGCYCDQNIILTLTGGNPYLASRGSAGYMSRAAGLVTRPKTASEKREQCLACPIYLHHQAQKYKVVAPLVLIAILGATALFWIPIQAFYPAAMRVIGRALVGFQFDNVTGGVPNWANDLATATPMMWLVLFVVGLILISYSLQAVEWVLFRLGL